MKLAIMFILLALNALMGFPFNWIILMLVPFAWDIFKISACFCVILLTICVALVFGDSADVSSLFESIRVGLLEGLK